MLEECAAGLGAIWAYLTLARGGFWRVREQPGAADAPVTWPRVAVVVPARNEALTIGVSVKSLLAQDYPGDVVAILVDDQSADDTTEVARRAAEAGPAQHKLVVVHGQPLPFGWAGKVWALHQGIENAVRFEPEYLLFADADLEFAPRVLQSLVSDSCRHGFVLDSLMAKLRCESFAERALVPAFVFFFQMLYPFAWVNRRGSTTAAAAGGCMLVHRPTLEAAGNMQAIRDARIDDCALARLLKPHGPIRLALTRCIVSLRAYDTIRDFGAMVSRSAYVQLRYSPLRLIATIGGLLLTFVAPPTLALLATGYVQAAGALAWLMMAILFQPMLRFYRRSPLWGAALPVIGLVYAAFTLESALRHAQGRGGLWKGRVQTRSAAPQ